MAKIKFSNNINVSMQVGDKLYQTAYATSDGFDIGGNPTYVGLVTSIGSNYIETDGTPTSGSFFMFLKNNVVNSSSVIGEYSEVTLKNNSKEQAELFSLGSEVTISSK